MNKQLIPTSETWTSREGKTYKIFQEKVDWPRLLIIFGQGGHTEYHAPKEGYGLCTTQGYGARDTFFAPMKWWAHDYATTKYLPDWEGLPWIDMTQAVETKIGRAMVFHGPMVDPKLKDGEVDLCPMPSDLFAASIEKGNGFAPLLEQHSRARAAKAKYSGLDSVSIPEYIRLWKIAGAKSGIIKNGEFVEQ